VSAWAVAQVLTLARAWVQVNLVGDGGVLAAVAHHVHDAVLQALDLLAQHLGLALLQADGARAVAADQLHARSISAWRSKKSGFSAGSRQSSLR
jgi:hypothetical protein